jgi:hypothetical protein
MTNRWLKPAWFLVLLVGVVCSGCDSTLPEVRQAAAVDEVTISDVVANPAKFHGLRVRVKGLCRIEFEGTALYKNPDAYRQRRGTDGVWLRVGWPVLPGIQALDGQEVSIEGTFDHAKKGHDAAYVGSLIEIKDIAGIAISVDQ